MPTLKDFLNERELFPAGTYTARINEIAAQHPENTEWASSVVIKCKTADDKALTIFRSTNEKMQWAIAEDLLKLGTPADAEVPELNDADAVAEFMQEFVGQTVNVKVTVRNYTSREGEAKQANNFKITGTASGAALV